jgi:hypothetical protein
MTTNTFNHAQYLHRTLMTAKDELETHLRASLQDYIDFLPERGLLWVPEKYTNASDYKFITTDGSHFVFETEEFKSVTLQAIRDAEAKSAAQNKEAAQIRVDNLRRQLEVAERALEEGTK